MYTGYVTPTEYAEMGFNAIPAEDRAKFLNEASRQVDTMTFNRIVAKGFDHLTQFQQDIVKQVVCDQAEFLFENADAISSVLDSYSINGVSMRFGTGFNVVTEESIPTQGTTYSLLQQTGLCSRLAR